MQAPVSGDASPAQYCTDTPPTGAGGQRHGGAGLGAAHASATDLETMLVSAQHLEAQQQEQQQHVEEEGGRDEHTSVMVNNTSAQQRDKRSTTPRIPRPSFHAAATAAAGAGADSPGGRGGGRLRVGTPPHGGAPSGPHPGSGDTLGQLGGGAATVTAAAAAEVEEEGDDAMAGHLLSTLHAACDEEDEEVEEEEEEEPVAAGQPSRPRARQTQQYPPRRRDGPEHITVAPDGGFVIVTRGGRTLHHRRGCLCKPCLARRRALDDGVAVAVAPCADARDGGQYEAPRGAAPKPAPSAQLPTPGAGPGRGNKLCNGCGAVVRNGLRECPHCLFAFLPLRRDEDGAAAAPAAGPPGHAVSQRKRGLHTGDGGGEGRAAKEPRREHAGHAAPGGVTYAPGGHPSTAWGGHSSRRSMPSGGGGGGGGFPQGGPAWPQDQAPQQPHVRGTVPARPGTDVLFAAPTGGPLELWVRLAGGCDPDFEVIRWDGPRTLRSLHAACTTALEAGGEAIPAGWGIKHLRWLDNDARGPGRGATKLRTDTDVLSLRVQDRIEVVLAPAPAPAAADTPPLQAEGSAEGRHTPPTV